MCTSIWFSATKKMVSSVRELTKVISPDGIRWYDDITPEDVTDILSEPDQCLCSVDIMATARANGVSASNDHDGDSMMYLWPMEDRR